MDIVVVLALVVLTFVFVLSLIILVITCQRRRHRRDGKKNKLLAPFKTPPTRFTRSVDEIETMEQLTELLGELLDKNPWLYEARGIMQHVVAVLTIAKTMTSKLANIQMPTSPSAFHDAVNMAMRNIYPRFDDLIESLATQPIDMRLLEARAMSLGTVCWSLYLPYTLMDVQHKEVLQKPLNEMNLHLVTIRTAAHLIVMADKGGENLDLVDLKDHLMRMRRQMRGELLLDDDYETEEDVEDEEEHHDPNGLVGRLGDHEKTPLVQSEAIIDMIELHRVPHHEKVLMSNGSTPDKLSNSSSPVHHHHHQLVHQQPTTTTTTTTTNLHHHGSLNTVEEEMNEEEEEDHHHEGTSTSCSSSSTSSHPPLDDTPPSKV